MKLLYRYRTYIDGGKGLRMDSGKQSGWPGRWQWCLSVGTLRVDLKQTGARTYWTRVRSLDSSLVLTFSNCVTHSDSLNHGEPDSSCIKWDNWPTVCYQDSMRMCVKAFSMLKHWKSEPKKVSTPPYTHQTFGTIFSQEPEVQKWTVISQGLIQSSGSGVPNLVFHLRNIYLLIKEKNFEPLLYTYSKNRNTSNTVFLKGLKLQGAGDKI